MSRNFELLQRAELDRKQAVPHETSVTAAAAAASPAQAPIAIQRDARSKVSQAEITPEVFDLVQRLFLMPNEWSPRCVVFFSLGGPAQGESVCARAAEALALQSTGTVCVVDANFTSPVMHDLYSVANTTGFSDALSQNAPVESYAHQVEDTNLVVIPAGSNLGAGKSALATESARQRMAEVRSRFDYVLIEAPANMSISSAVLLGQMADGAVVVVEANETRREVARNVVDELIASNVRVLGAVLNNRRYPIPQKLYKAL